ncbi:GntR family transcriptional regulator [Comamonadaceae bacterium PP-2]
MTPYQTASETSSPQPKGARSAAVFETLRRGILQVQLVPGQALSENELAGHLGVSRTPIREAMQRLASEGLVDVVPQVVTRVALLELPQIKDALFVREAIETTALLQQNAPWPAVGIERLAKVIDAQESAVTNGDHAQVMSLDEAFHRHLIELCGHAGVWPYVQRAREVHARLRALAQSLPRAADRSVQQHRDIVAALQLGKVADAVDLMRTHIRMNMDFAEELARQLTQYFKPYQN